MMGRLLAIVAVLTGCYNAPSPTCGFICGTGGACPGGYTCNDNDHRCHLEGTTDRCQEYADADIPDASPYPMVVATSPNPGDLNAGVSSPIIATFNVPVIGVDNTTFTVTSDGAPIDGSADAVDNVATFHPKHLPSGKPVQATITSGITDLGGRRVAMHTWSFTVQTDTTPPMVTMSDPVDGKTDFPTGEPVTLVFSEDVQGTDRIEISTGGVAIPGSWFYDVESGVYYAQFEPAMGVLPQVSVIDVAAPATIADYAGNALVPFSMQFTTVDLLPEVEFTSPPDGDIDVPTDTTIDVTFTEPVTNVNATSFIVDGGLVTGTLASSSGGQVWSFTPDAALPAASLITVELTTAITDLTGNAMTAPKDVSFTTQ